LGDITSISVYNAAYKTSIDTSEIWINYNSVSSFTTDLVSTYGNKEKGIFTIEYLLFHASANDSLSVPKYQNYISAQLNALLENFVLIKNSWTTYHTNFVSNTDEGVEGSYNIIINRIVHLLEDVVNKRISPSLSAGNSEGSVGYYSNTSWTNILVLVSQIQEIYLGKGTSDFNSIYNCVHKKNKKLADDLKSKLETIVKTGESMTESLAYYSSTGSVQLTSYKEKLTEILVLFKLDVVSELDIVLTFGDSDGD
jgi:predicted lipoprotein